MRVLTWQSSSGLKVWDLRECLSFYGMWLMGQSTCEELSMSLLVIKYIGEIKLILPSKIQGGQLEKDCFHYNQQLRRVVGVDECHTSLSNHCLIIPTLLSLCYPCSKSLVESPYHLLNIPDISSQTSYTIMIPSYPSRIYFLNSTVFLYTATFTYLILAIAWGVHSVSLLFSSLYALELLAKYSVPNSIYWAPYFTWPFVVIDIISGPVALGFCIDNTVREVQGVHLGCVLIISKVLTCRLNIKIMKELAYVFKATLRYFRLSVSLGLCFVVMSYFLFQPYSKFFGNIGESFYSMYQLCTFDGWINQSAKQIRENSSNYWLLYFAVYFVIIMLCYLIAIMSFFMIYYSNQNLKQDFDFKLESFITVKDMANRLGLKRDEHRTLIAKAEIIIIYYTAIATLEWMYPQAMDLRPLFIVVSLVYSISYMTYRVVTYGWCWNLSHLLLFYRGVICSLLFLVLMSVDASLNYLIGIYMFSCVFDLIRHNILLQTVLRRFYKNIIQYLIILSFLCYFFAVMLFKRKSLVRLNSTKENFLDLYLLNIQIIGFDGWGDTAHGIIEERIGWVWCLIFLVFIGAMTITNMFLGEVLMQMAPYIKEILKVQKLYYTKLEYQDLGDFEERCRRELQRETLDQDDD